MLSGDDEASARAEAEGLESARFEQFWDPEREAARLFAETLALEGVAWDVYLLYAPGVRWNGDRPPPPTFWMLQLPREVGADEERLLNPGVLGREIAAVVGLREAELPANLALRLHAKGLAAVTRNRAAGSEIPA